MSKAATVPKLLLLGWAGADWRIIQPLLDAGRMPHLESLILDGVMGKLLSLEPMVPPALWASIATGRRADAHGILGRIMPGPDRFGVRPVASTDLQLPPLWQIVNNAGRSAAAVGWPATHPATVFDGLVVSDAFAEARGADFDGWPLRPHAVSDPGLQETMADLRLHPTEVTAETVLPFIPGAKRIDQETDERLALLVASLARTASIHAAGTWIAAHREWDLLAVHFDLIERLSAAFMQYRAPRMPHVTETDFALYREVVDGAYQFMDLMLGRYLELIEPETHVLLVSAHGFLTDHLRPPPAAKLQGDRTTRLYRELGILVLRGPRIKQDELVFGATLLDLAPTALTLLGLPVSRELEGRVLTQAFENPAPPETVPAYPALDFQARAPGEWDRDGDWAAGRIVELVALGYLPAPPGDPTEAAEQATIQRLDNLAKVRIAKREHREALAVLEELLELAPEHGEARLEVAQCRYALNDTRGCREALDDLVASGLRGAAVDYLYGQLCAKEGDAEGAGKHLQRAEEAGFGGRVLLERIGRVHLQTQHWAEAEQSFRKALDIDPDFAQAHNGLGFALANQKHHQEAVEHLMWSLGLLYHQPDAHFHLGLSLAALGRSFQAMEALRNALAIQPEFSAARTALGQIERGLARRTVDSVRSVEE
jgi:tetratricopeptide (TPR) repeat protein